jgi:hypothetical protein
VDADQVRASAEASGCTTANEQCMLNQMFTLEELRTAVKGLSNSSAATADRIFPSMIKSAMPCIERCLLKCMNAMYSAGKFPHSWSCGWVTPLFKKGDRSLPVNYRGITVCSHLSKVFTSMLNARFSRWTDLNDKISPLQGGFRKGRSTTDQCVLLKSVVDVRLAAKQKTFAVFVDFKQAYDRVWRCGLFHKLATEGADGRFIATNKSMYRQAESKVKVGQTSLSQPFQAECGLRQGCTLSPMLFNLFINDILQWIVGTAGADLCSTNGRTLPGILYADDLVLLSTSVVALQRQLDALARYCAKWGMTVNVTKSQAMCFASRKCRAGELLLLYQNHPVEVVDEFVYLGVLFFWNGRFCRAVQARKRKAEKALFSLWDLTRDCDIAPKCMLSLYNSLVKSTLLYGCEVWGCEKLTDRSPVELVHNRALRSILGVGKHTTTLAVHGELGTLPVRPEIQGRMCWYLGRCQAAGMVPWIEWGPLPQLPRHAWTKAVHDLVVSHGLGFVWYNLGRLNVQPRLKQLLKQRFVDIAKQRWHADLAAIDPAVSKLGIFKLVKRGHGYEPYLSLLPRRLRTALAKVRLSAHKLRVETGRHCRPPLPREQRICLRCNRLQVDDELHLVFDCDDPHIAETRTALRLEAGRTLGQQRWRQPDDQRTLKLLCNAPTPQLLETLAELCILAC